MSIIYSKVGASRPLIGVDVFPMLWWQQVRDDRHSVLVVVPHQTLVRIRRIGPYHTVALVGSLSWLIVWNDDLVCWLDGEARVLIWLIYGLKACSTLLGRLLVRRLWLLGAVASKVALTPRPATELPLLWL